MLEHENELKFFNKALPNKLINKKSDIFIEFFALLFGVIMISFILSYSPYDPNEKTVSVNPLTKSYGVENYSLSESVFDLNVRLKSANLNLNKADINSEAIDSIDIVISSSINKVINDRLGSYGDKDYLPYGNNLYLKNIDKDIVVLNTIKNHLIESGDATPVSEKTKEGIKFYFKNIQDNLKKVTKETFI